MNEINEDDLEKLDALVQETAIGDSVFSIQYNTLYTVTKCNKERCGRKVPNLYPMRYRLDNYHRTICSKCSIRH